MASFKKYFNTKAVPYTLAVGLGAAFLGASAVIALQGNLAGAAAPLLLSVMGISGGVGGLKKLNANAPK